MENLEISARTVEEATQKALTQLNVGLDEVEITVLNEGKSGILGLGSEDARIRVRINRNENRHTETREMAEEVLENLLNKMGLETKITLENPKTIPVEEGDTEPIVFNI